jgi:hypothetical protein
MGRDSNEQNERFFIAVRLDGAALDQWSSEALGVRSRNGIVTNHGLLEATGGLSTCERLTLSILLWLNAWGRRS